MMRALFSAIAGLRNHITYMDVVGNNIANVNTIAYKSDRVTFQDMLGQTLKGSTAPTPEGGGTNPQQVGLGMQIGAIDTLHQQGSIQSTGKLTDFAIQGDGFFVLNDGTRTVFTRDGGFDLATNGDLVNPSNGFKVMGWKADSTGKVDTATALQPLSIPFGTQVSAKPTTKIEFAGNLDAALGLQGTVGTTATVYDSLGVLNTVKLTFTKVKANYWSVSNSASNMTKTSSANALIGAGSGSPNALRPGRWTITDDGAGNLTAQFQPAEFTAPNTLAIPGTNPPETAITGTIAAGGTNNTLIPGLTISAPAVFGAGGTATIDITGTVVEFDSGGQLVQSSPQVTISLTNTNGATSPQAVLMNISKFSQYAGQARVSASSQDGFPAGSLVTFSVGQTGDVTGIFSNGSNLKLGQMAMALFTNPGGMLKAGNNLFEPGSNSGDPLIGLPNAGGRGIVSSGTLEASNTNLAQEFTSIIIAERGFQASSRVISAADEMLQDLVNLKR